VIAGSGENKQIGTNRVGVMYNRRICGGLWKTKIGVGYKQRGALRSPMVKV